MHRRPQDYDYFRRLQPSVFKIMDGGPPDYQWARENLPNSLIVARDWAMSEQHTDMLKDPVATGKRHAEEWNGHQARLGFDKAKTLILGINEPRIWEPGVPEALRVYTIALCDRATQLGLRVGAMQLSVGWPNNTGPDTLPDWAHWHGVDNAIRHNNGALICHEYWADSGPGELWGWWAGRSLKCPWDVPIVIGECGIDMYVKDGSVAHQTRGWQGRKTPGQYASELADYVGRMSVDPRFVGCAVFASDFANREWASFDVEPAYHAILSTPIPASKPDTKPFETHLPILGSGPEPVSKPSIVYVTAVSGLNLRATPNGDILTAIPYGDAVTVTGVASVNGWLRATYQGHTGWLAAGYVSATPPAPLPPQPTEPTGTTALDPLVLEAILKVESGGRGYGGDGRLLIRFEAHLFLARGGNPALFRHDQQIPWADQQWRRTPSEDWRAIHTGSQADEYAAFEFAMSQNREAAYQSISMGAPQIMGFNHARIGYPNAQAMFSAFQRSLAAQMVGFLNFILADAALVTAINRKDFEGIARGYNGAGNVAMAAAKYKAAYESLREQSQ